MRYFGGREVLQEEKGRERNREEGGRKEGGNKKPTQKYHFCYQPQRAETEIEKEESKCEGRREEE